MRDPKAKEAVCRAFSEALCVKFPSETQERRYYERLVQAYPIHPEVFSTGSMKAITFRQARMP